MALGFATVLLLVFGHLVRIAWRPVEIVLAILVALLAGEERPRYGT